MSEPARATRALVEVELEALERLRVAIVESLELGEVQDRVVGALIGPLAMSWGLVGLVDPGHTAVGSWLCRSRSPATVLPNMGKSLGILHTPLLAEAFASAGRLVEGELAGVSVAAVALQYRSHPIALIAVPPIPKGTREARLLERFSAHAAETLAGVQLCVERVQRLAVEGERNRISMDLHDAVIQSMFAINCSLEGCVRMLESGDPGLAEELLRTGQLAGKALQQLRRSIHDIWPGELLERQFATDLRDHVADLTGSAGQLGLEVDIRGDLARISGRARRVLFRVSQEALSNVIRHSGALNA